MKHVALILVLICSAVGTFAQSRFFGGTFINESPDTHVLQIDWSYGEIYSGHASFDVLPGETHHWSLELGEIPPMEGGGYGNVTVDINEEREPNEEIGYSLVSTGSPGLSAPDFTEGPTFPISVPTTDNPIDSTGEGWVFTWAADSQVVNPTPSTERTLWRVAPVDGVLTAEIYMEGVDKMVYANTSLQQAIVDGGTGGGTTALHGADLLPADIGEIGPGGLTEAGWTAMQAHAQVMADFIEDTLAPDILDAFEEAYDGNPTTGTITAAGSIGTGTDMLPQLETPVGIIQWRFTAVLADWETYAALMRELLLYLWAFYFFRACQTMFETYWGTWWKVPGYQAAPSGAADVAQVWGWGKQLLGAGVLTAALVGIVTVFIVGINSQASAIIGDLAFGNVMSRFSDRISDIAGNAAGAGYLAKGWAFVNMFIPVAALWQFVAAFFVIRLFAAPTWTAALAVAKYFRL